MDFQIAAQNYITLNLFVVNARLMDINYSQMKTPIQSYQRV